MGPLGDESSVFLQECSIDPINYPKKVIAQKDRCLDDKAAVTKGLLPCIFKEGIKAKRGYPKMIRNLARNRSRFCTP